MKYFFHIFKNEKQVEVFDKVFEFNIPDKKRLEEKSSKLLLLAGGFFQKGLTYTEFIGRIAINRDIKLAITASSAEKERYLFEKISLQNLNKMCVE
jgi:hypothetical protein